MADNPKRQEANVKFAMPYFQNRKFMTFTDSAGTQTQLKSFGIREEDAYAYFKLRRQPAVLFTKRDDHYQLKECIVDLDRKSMPSQIVVALVEPKRTLAETMNYVRTRMAGAELKGGGKGLGSNDTMLVPDIAWRIGRIVCSQSCPWPEPRNHHAVLPGHNP